MNIYLKRPRTGAPSSWRRLVTDIPKSMQANIFRMAPESIVRCTCSFGGLCKCILPLGRSHVSPRVKNQRDLGTGTQDWQQTKLKVWMSMEKELTRELKRVTSMKI